VGLKVPGGKMIMSVILSGILYVDTYTNLQLELIYSLILNLLFWFSLLLLIYYIMDRMIDNPKPSKVDILVSALLTTLMIFLVNYFSYIYGVLASLIISPLLLATSGHLLIYLAERTVNKPEQSKKDILTLILLSALLFSTIFSLLIPILWNTPP
jgi:Na+/melibiose symporter-like transporter